MYKNNEKDTPITPQKILGDETWCMHAKKKQSKLIKKIFHSENLISVP